MCKGYFVSLNDVYKVRYKRDQGKGIDDKVSDCVKLYMLYCMKESVTMIKIFVRFALRSQSLLLFLS